MAELCLAVPGLTPEAYWRLSAAETHALIDVLNEQTRARQKAAKRR